MYKIHTEIIIRSKPERIWDILLDFKNYPAWNPFLISIQGQALQRAMLSVVMKPRNSGKMAFKPKVLIVENMKELRWLGRLVLPGLFDGEHILSLRQANPEETIFVQEENFNGILVPLLKKMLEQNTKPAFEEMNIALKKLAEDPNYIKAVE